MAERKAEKPMGDPNYREKAWGTISKLILTLKRGPDMTLLFLRQSKFSPIIDTQMND